MVIPFSSMSKEHRVIKIDGISRRLDGHQCVSRIEKRATVDPDLRYLATDRAAHSDFHLTGLDPDLKA